MNIKYLTLLVFVFGNGSSYKPQHQIERQSKSIFSNKRCKEIFTPARYQIKCKNFKFDQPTGEKILTEQYFPDVEYPTNIMEIAKPFFYKATEGNGMLGPFPDEVQSSFRTLINKNQKSLSEVRAKYMNDFILNSKTCTQNTPKQETVIVDMATSSIDKSNELVSKLVEVTNEQVTEYKPSSVEDKIKEDLIDTAGESEDERVENKDDLAVVFDTPVDIEDVHLESQIGSWESEQTFSFEISHDEVEVLSDGNNSSLVYKLPDYSEELMEEANNFTLNEAQESESPLISATENPETSECPTSLEMKSHTTGNETKTANNKLSPTTWKKMPHLKKPLDCRKCII